MCSLTPEELSRDYEILRRSNFTEAIKLKCEDSLSLPRERGGLSSRRKKMRNELTSLLMR